MNYSEFIKNTPHIPIIRLRLEICYMQKSWQTEAPLRMLLNNLDRQVAETLKNLWFMAARGRQHGIPKHYCRSFKSLLQLDENHSLLVQSGKAVGIVRTHPEAPRYLLRTATLFRFGLHGIISKN